MLTLLQLLTAACITFFFVVLVLRPRVADIVYIGIMVLYHFLFVWVFYFITIGDVTDSHNYFIWAEGEGVGEFVGTGFIVSLVSLFRSVIGSEYFSVLLVFSGLSAFGLACVYVCLSKLCRDWGADANTLLILRIGMLLPGLHFWTGPIGKDAVILLGYGLLALSVFGRSGLRWGLLGLGMFITFLVRPHVGGCAIIILLVYMNRHAMGNVNGVRRWVLGLFFASLAIAFAIGFYVFMLGFVQKYSGAGFESMAEFLSERQGVYAETGSGFDSSDFPFVVRYLLFFLGGIPWAIGNVLQFVAMLEGVFICILLLLVTRMVWRTRNVSRKERNLKGVILRNRTAFIFYYAMFLATVLSYSAGNFGLIVRQRVMVYLPLLIAFVVLRILYPKLIRKFQAANGSIDAEGASVGRIVG